VGLIPPQTDLSSGSKPSASTVSTAPAASAEELLYVLDGSASATNSSAGQHIIAFHPGSASHVTLPAGLFSQDHQRVYNGCSQIGQTAIAVTNAQTGANIRTFTIPGTYSGFRTRLYYAVLSTDGHWLALRQIGKQAL